MYDSPSSLQDVCIEFICDNLEELCAIPNSSKPPSSGTETAFGSEYLTFIESDVYFHSELSEQLICTLSEKGKLSDNTISLFDAKTARLRHVRIKNASALSTKGLKVLKAHKISCLEVVSLKVTVNELIGCLGEWTLQNLRSLNVARSSFINGSKYCVVVALSKLRNLRCLNVSWTEFNRHGLEIVTEDLPFLESLDISCTRVDDISPLRKCKDRLKSLYMYNLKVITSDVSILFELQELRVLDFSDEKENHGFELFPVIQDKATVLLKGFDKMPHLTYLDISGREDINPDDLKIFIDNHKDIQFLGLIHCDVCFEEFFVNPQCEGYYKTLLVAGTATEAQIMEGLKRYSARPFYVQKCLYHLFRLTPTFTDARVDIIKLVLPGMMVHAQQFGVQMAATACLYNLTKGDIALKIHPRVLKQIVELTLQAMETFPSHYQLQKNTLLTLCSDRILQDVSFDKYRCARLVMNSLCTFYDASMNRMSVAICSILAAKISTNETSLLGAQPKYMQKLLDIVRSKVAARSADITIKFTLSALWNLTDESPKTCSVFLEEGGMELFLKVLETFEDESAVETKVLGLINNIAEVSELRSSLMVSEFIRTLRKLLHSSHIDVSYFAAGIVAHLASDGGEVWTVETIPMQELLEELEEVVMDWETPDGEMVAYRSFQPFFPLLKCFDTHQVQLWAVWAIHHVCTKNSKRYCPMFIEEGGTEILQSLLENSVVNFKVKFICENILYVLSLEKPKNVFL